MNVLIVEDEMQTALRMEEMLVRYDGATRVLDKIPSVEKAVSYFNAPNAVKPDLVFMDIHLEDDLAFRIFEQTEVTVPVIFTTAFNEYALRAFKVFSIDYLLKPIDYEELCQALDKFRSLVKPALTADRMDEFIRHYHKPEYKDRFLVSVGSRMHSVAVGNIAYFCYERRLTVVYTNDGKHYGLDYSLDKLGAMLDPRLFFRINRSCIVSLEAVTAIFQQNSGRLVVEVSPRFSEELVVSLDRVTAFKEWLGK